jgi:NADPH:quinone reductase
MDVRRTVIMHVVRIHSYGDPEVMHLEDVSLPEPGPDQIRVRVMVAGVNFSDIATRRAPHPFFPAELPLPLGNEGAGVVEAVGPGVTTVSVGDRVVWAWVHGSYATHVLAPVQQVFPIPASITFEQAVALIMQGSMAHILARSVYPLKPDDTCLIQSVSGGVGLLLCQLAKISGAHVIGVTSTTEKARVASEAGADHVLLYSQEDVKTQVRSLTQERGVNVVYDAVGKATFETNLDCLAIRGTFVLYGAASGPVPPFQVYRLAEKGSLFLTQVALVHYIRSGELPAILQDLFKLVQEGSLRLHIGATFPLVDAASAHEALEQGQTIGKVLLYP